MMFRMNRLLACLVVIGFSLPLSAAETTDPSGTWRWEYEMQGETRKAKLQLQTKPDTSEFVGKFISDDDTEVEIKEGKIDGDELTFDLPIDFDGNEMVLQFSGKLDKDEIDGEVSVEANGETYEFPWSPVRSVKADDVVGTWVIEITTPAGDLLKPTLKITENDDGDLKAAYTSQLLGELKVEKFDLRDNQVQLNISTEYEGDTAKVEYRGRPYGNKMSGKYEYDFRGDTGSGPFKATRKP